MGWVWLGGGRRGWASLLWHVTCHVVVTCLLLTRVPLPCRLVNPGFPLSTLFVAFVIIIISRILIVALIIIMIISIQFNVVHTGLTPWSSDTGSHGWGPFEFPHSTTSVDVWIYPATLLLSLTNVVSIN